MGAHISLLFSLLQIKGLLPVCRLPRSTSETTGAIFEYSLFKVSVFSFAFNSSEMKIEISKNLLANISIYLPLPFQLYFCTAILFSNPSNYYDVSCFSYLSFYLSFISLPMNGASAIWEAHL